MPKSIDPLTDIPIRTAKPREKSYKLSDGAGMYLEVTRFQNDVFPPIGKYPIAAVDAPVLLDVLRRVEKRGAATGALRSRKQPVFLADSDRANRIFDRVMPTLRLCRVISIHAPSTMPFMIAESA